MGAGVAIGVAVGAAVGVAVGAAVGAAVGIGVGLGVGTGVGFGVGSGVFSGSETAKVVLAIAVSVSVVASAAAAAAFAPFRGAEPMARVCSPVVDAGMTIVALKLPLRSIVTIGRPAGLPSQLSCILVLVWRPVPWTVTDAPAGPVPGDTVRMGASVAAARPAVKGTITAMATRMANAVGTRFEERVRRGSGVALTSGAQRVPFQKANVELHSATRLTQGVPWLCGPASRQVCSFVAPSLHGGAPGGSEPEQWPEGRDDLVVPTVGVLAGFANGEDVSVGRDRSTAGPSASDVGPGAVRFGLGGACPPRGGSRTHHHAVAGARGRRARG